MERRWSTRLSIVVAVAPTALVVVACADDSNAGRTNSVINGAVDTPDDPAGTPADADAAEQFEIEIADFQFGPPDAVVAAGTKVVWVNADTDIHSIISTGELFPSSDTFATAERYAVVFAEPGTYEYTCGVHPFMTGTITVQ